MFKKVFRKLINIVSVFLIFISIFTMNEKIVEADNTVEKTFNRPFTKDYRTFSNFMVVLGNHDSNTFVSVTYVVTEKESGGVVAEPITYTSLDQADSDASTPENSIYCFSFETPNNLVDGKEYIASITVVSNYDHEFTKLVNGFFVVDNCLGRIEVTKTWDDNNYENRPTAEDYKSCIKLNGAAPDRIETVSSSGNTYKYVAYGGLINIHDEVVISEDVPEGYILSKDPVNSVPFYDPNNVDLIEYDGYNIQNLNVSRASLSNKKVKPFFDIKFLKTDLDGRPLEGAVFTITNIGDVAVTINGTTLEPEGTMNISSNSDGLVELKNIPSNGKYKIEETEAPYGYKEPTFSKEFSVLDSKEVQGQENYLLELEPVTNDLAKFLIKKVWDDGNNVTHSRPESITVTLINKADENDKLEFVVTPDDSGNWELELTSLDGIKPGVEYYVEEDFVEGYTSETQSTAGDPTTFTITNKLINETAVAVIKIWDDNHDEFGLRPTEEELKEKLILFVEDKDYYQTDHYIKVASLAELEEMGYQVDIITENIEDYIFENGIAAEGANLNLDDKDSWLVVVSGLEKYYEEDGKFKNFYRYKIWEDETLLEDYVLTYISGPYERTAVHRIVNATGQGDLVVEAAKQLDGKKLEDKEFEFELKDAEGETLDTKQNDANGNVVFDPIHVEFKDLEPVSFYDATDEQKENIEYWLSSELNSPGIPEGYRQTAIYLVSSDMIPGETTSRGRVFSETTEEERKAAVNPDNLNTIKWKDENNITYYEKEMLEYMFETYPESKEALEIDFEFYAYAKEFDFTIEEVSGNEADVTYDEHVANVKAYVYYDGSTELKTKVLIEDEDNVFTNTFRTNIKVEKKWDDDENKLKQRPDSIVIKLLANGEETGKTVTLNESNNWKATFEGLEKYDGEKEIEYSVSEEKVEGYEDPVITGNEKTGFIVTNKIIRASVNVEKKWDDNDDEQKLRPSSITVKLLADGEETGDVLVLSKSNSWKGTFKDLPKYNDDKKEIKYTVKEDKVESYEEPVISGDAEKGFTITNRIKNKPTPKYEIPKTGVE